jgi:ribose transport system substrate-binding protein
VLQLTRRSGAVAVALAVGSLVVAACGSSDEDSGSTGGTSAAATSAGTSTAAAGDDALALADKTVEEFSSPVQWPGPNDKVTPPTGKKLTVIICGSQGITCVRVGNGVKAAGEALGYDVKVVDGRSDPTVWNQAIKSAVADKTDGIALAAIPPAVVAGAIKSAKAAGVPVAAGLSTAGEAEVKVNPNRTDSARAQAAYVAKDSGGKAKVLVVRDDEFPETKQASDEFATQLKQMCPDCEIADSTDFTLALAAQRLSGKVTQALRNNPDVDYIVPPFDTVNVFIQQGIAQAQKKGKVKIVGVGGDPPSVDAIKAGDEVASVGQAGEWIGWDLVDGLTRIFAGQEVPPLDQETDSNYVAPQRYITADTELDPQGWQGGFDYQSKYKELWGK